MHATRIGLGLFGAAAVAAMVTGCASTGESAAADRLTQHVGQYPPPPRGVERPKIGVPAFQVQTAPGSVRRGQRPQEMEFVAADQMSTLLHMTRRFDVIERAQLDQLLHEQDLEGIVRADQLARAGQVEGVDYLLIGRVTNFRVRQDQTERGVDVGGLTRAIPGLDRRPGWGRGRERTGFEQRESRIITECGVDIRIVDPTTGRVVAQNFGEFTRTDSASALGVSVLGVGGRAGANVEIDQDDAGKILRLAFDEALRRMMPEIDQLLVERKAPEAATAVREAVAAETPAEAPARAGFCAQCGGALAQGARFCGGCGAAVPQ